MKRYIRCNITSIDSSYFDRFSEIFDMYLSTNGEGSTMADRLVFAIKTLIDGWYDHDSIYEIDTTWQRSSKLDLSGYANWIYTHFLESRNILRSIWDSTDSEDYEWILAMLADNFLVEDKLEELDRRRSYKSVYHCDGPFDCDPANIESFQ